MTFDTVLTQFSNGDISFDELVALSVRLPWGERVSDPDDGSVDWVGENLFADIYNTVPRGILTLEQRRVLLDAVTAAQK